MRQYREIVIGFDSRQYPPLPPTESDYLLRSDIVGIISVYEQAWPSIVGENEPTLPDWIGPVQQMWADLNSLTSYVSENKRDVSYWTVAITQFVDERDATETEWAYRITPRTISRFWVRIGYDVATRFLVSALNEWEHGGLENNRLGQPWSQKLNKHHLFDSQDDAAEFMRMYEWAYQEESPFSVYGIYFIERHLQEGS